MSRTSVAITSFLLGLVPVSLWAGHVIHGSDQQRDVLARDIAALRQEIESLRFDVDWQGAWIFEVETKLQQLQKMKSAQNTGD